MPKDVGKSPTSMSVEGFDALWKAVAIRSSASSRMDDPVDGLFRIHPGGHTV